MVLHGRVGGWGELADKLLQVLYGAKEFFISEQLGHKWLQSHLNIV